MYLSSQGCFLFSEGHQSYYIKGPTYSSVISSQLILRYCSFRMSMYLVFFFFEDTIQLITKNITNLFLSQGLMRIHASPWLKCGTQISSFSITWSLLEMQNLGHHSRWKHQNLCFNTIPRWLVCTLKSEKQCSQRWRLSNPADVHSDVNMAGSESVLLGIKILNSSSLPKKLL